MPKLLSIDRVLFAQDSRWSWIVSFRAWLDSWTRLTDVPPKVHPVLNLFYPVRASMNVESNFLLRNSLNAEILFKTGSTFCLNQHRCNFPLQPIFLSFLVFATLFCQFYKITETMMILINLALLYPSLGDSVLVLLLPTMCFARKNTIMGICLELWFWFPHIWIHGVSTT